MTLCTRITALLTLAAALTGCATTSQQVDLAVAGDRSDGLIQQADAEGAIVFVRPEAPGLGDYDTFIVDPVRVDYTDPSLAELPVEQVERIRRYFQDAMIRTLSEAGYSVGTRSSDDRLRISMTLSGLKAPSAAGNVTALLVPVAVGVGEVTVEAEFRNAVSEQIDALVITRSQGSRFLNATPWSTWADVEASLDQWAEDFAAAVDAAHGG